MNHERMMPPTAAIEAALSEAPERLTGTAASLQRIQALVLRHLRLLFSSWARLVEIVYWPTMQMLLWGFITLFLTERTDWLAQAAGTLLSGLLLWEVLYRSQLGVNLALLEEIWARNLATLFVSPLRPWEMIAAMLTVAGIRVAIGTGAAAALAWPLYHYDIFTLGWPLLPFLAALMIMGWSIGLMVASLLLRVGLGAEGLAWAAIFVLQPISGIYYPIEVLPGWLQPVAWVLPSAHIFEGMRQVLIDGTIPWRHLAWAFALDGVLVVMAAVAFTRATRAARRDGRLLASGE